MAGEQLSRPATREQLSIALLRFIGQTSAFEAEYKRRRDHGAFIPAFIYLEGFRPVTPTSIVIASRQSINGCLKDLGGIETTFDDTSSGLKLPCTLLEWQGNHPKSDGQHIWKASFPQKGVYELTMESSAIHELIEKFAGLKPDGPGTRIEPFAANPALNQQTSAPGYL